MRPALFSTALLIALIHHICFAATIYIPADYPTIQGGIDAATNGDTVLVSAGTYTGYGNIDLDYSGKNITVLSVSGSETTIIDCLNSGRGVIFQNGETEEAVFHGFTVRNGFAKHGGGILSLYSSPVIRGCRVLCCIVYDTSIFYNDDGGGICIHGGSPQIDNCRIQGNMAGRDGGGICCKSYSEPSIVNSAINSNHIYGSGGGLYCEDSSIYIYNCQFNGNSSRSTICGASIINSDMVISSSTFSGNTGDGVGSTLFCGGSGYPHLVENCVFSNNESPRATISTGSHITLMNCTIVNNRGDYAGGIYIPEDTYTSDAINCIIWNNSPPQIYVDVWGGGIDVSYSDIMGGYGGHTNINEEPMFADQENNDYHIARLSPCVDSGTADGAPLTDFDGNPRPFGEGVDMGAYECIREGVWIASSKQRLNKIVEYPELSIEDEKLFILNVGTEPGSYRLTGGSSGRLTLTGDLSKVLQSGGHGTINLHFNTTGIVPGLYSDTLTLQSTDPVTPELNIPVTLSVYSRGTIKVPDHIVDMQKAIDIAMDGDTILVSPGTYTGKGNINLDFDYKSLHLISAEGPENTIVDCEFSGRFIDVEFRESQCLVIKGFSVNNGCGVLGGGCYFNITWPVPDQTLVISDCCFNNNHALLGGGIYSQIDTSPLTGCSFYNNFAYSGGGLYDKYQDRGLTGCSFIENHAIIGGGMYKSNGEPVEILQCTFTGNEAESGGSIFWYPYISGALTLNSCILWNNSPDEIYTEETGYELDILFSDITGGWPGEGNIDLDPLFADPDSTDYSLSPESPCIDAGDPALDIPLGGGACVDMGAFEYHQGWNILKHILPE